MSRRGGYELAAMGPAVSPADEADDVERVIGQPAASSSSPTAPGDPSTPAPLDLEGLERTFHAMKMRQLKRMSLDTMTNARPNTGTSVLWMITFAAIYAFYLCFQILYYGRSVNYALEFILEGLASLGMALFVWRVRLLIRVILIELYAALLCFFILSLYYDAKRYTSLGLVALGVVIITVAAFWAFYYLDAVVKRCSIFTNWHLRQVKEAGQPIARYELEQRTTCCWCCSGDITTCVFEGKLVNGRPEGPGAWLDSSYKGEFLRGYWHDGLPVGPFESVENDTRSVLVNLRIIVASDAAGRLSLEKKQMRMGVAGVECCVSGDFFKGFPVVSYTLTPAPCSCESPVVCECVRNILAKGHYSHVDDGKKLKSVAVAASVLRGGAAVLTVAGHQPLPSGSDSDAAPPRSVTISLVAADAARGGGGAAHLIVEGPWVGPDSDIAHEEGLLFIHGFDHSLDDTVKRFGQFLALAHLPRYLKPFAFNWPASTSHWCYWCASDLASDNDLHRDLRAFLQAIANAKVRRLHIMCHSLGARFFLRAFPLVKELFNSVTSEDRWRLQHSRSWQDMSAPATAQGMRRIDLANLILLNPDYDVDTFLNDFKELDLVCGRVSLYGDARDSALRMSEQLTCRSKLGTVVKGASPFPDSLDVIDTGDLDSNVNSVAHGYFNINKMMVEDLSELIVYNRPAEERTSRLKKCGKVFRFTLVPSSVMVV